MKLFCISHSYHYELENVIRLFSPFLKILVLKEWEEPSEEYLYTEKQQENEKITLVSKLSYNGSFYEDKKEYFNITENEAELYLAGMVFEQLAKEFKFLPNWGIVTGVRPSKLMASVIKEVGKENAKEHFVKKFLAKPQKAEMAFNVATAEEKIISTAAGDTFSLYISIPYCPTRCSYCSFVSHSISNAKARELIPEYVKKLCEELSSIAELAKKNSLKLKSVYWGGGTPTTLTAEQLDVILTQIEKSFDLSECVEYTVEAGRPDTITREKLLTLKKHNVNRISINPQTMNDETLVKIGRDHNVNDIIDTFHMARELGFDNINMDIILGLVDEDLDMVRNTLEKIKELDPESLTVHTLAIKRASTLKENLDKYELTRYEEMIKMIDLSMEYAKEMGLNPYYMYRQKHMLGNLENIGYAKEGYECIYNIQIMEEKQSNFAVGAGAITKYVYVDEDRIERTDNVKNVEQYIDRVDEMIQRKVKEVYKDVN
jgi:oxygen-independent coproporphyrinogen-3 oxidase